MVKRLDLKGVICVAVSGALLLGVCFNIDAIGGFCAARLLSAVSSGYTATAENTARNVANKNATAAFGYSRLSDTVNVTPKSVSTETPSDIKSLMLSAEKQYKTFEKTGDIVEDTLGAQSNVIKINNATLSNKAGEPLDAGSLENKTASFGKITKSKPYILIYHTHTTEGYELLDKGWYSDDYNSRSEDASKTVVRVGDEIAARLEEAGYGVIHDKQIYDRSYNGAYDRSEVTVRQILKDNPSVVVTLDIHRDAIHYDDGSKCKPTATVNGKKAAQIMIISGCEGGGVTDFPNWKENLNFAIAVQDEMAGYGDGLMRPIFFCHRRYNMDVTPCSLLVEFGTDANTLEEAVYSGSLFGTGLAALLDKNITG